MENDEYFKECKMCGKSWKTRGDFLADKELRLDGYTADFEELEYGLFYFTHQLRDCQSTMAIFVSSFLDLYTGTKYKDRKTGEEECPGYCLQKEQLARCGATCECAFVREVIQIIRQNRE